MFSVKINDKFNMLSLAHQIIYIANLNEQIIYPYQLQRVLYLVLKLGLNLHILPQSKLEALYDEPFLVWRYGPVIESIYTYYSVYNADPIIESEKPDPTLSVFDPYIKFALTLNPHKLGDIERAEPFYQNHKQYIHGWRSHVKYTLSDIKTALPKVHYMPHLNPFQKFTKKLYVKIKKHFDNLFEIQIALFDLKSMHPHHGRLSAHDVACLLFKQSLRDDFAHSETELCRNLDKNPYVPHYRLMYDQKAHKLYKFSFNTDLCRVISTSYMFYELTHSHEYMRYCQKVADAWNHKLH